MKDRIDDLSDPEQFACMVGKNTYATLNTETSTL